MNKLSIFVLCLVALLPFCFNAHGQAIRCETAFDVNIYNGTLNGLLPNASQESVSKIFPCLAQNVDSTEGAITWESEGVYFDFTNQYIEIDADYTAKISVDILNKHFQYAVAILGKPFIRDLPAEVEEQIVYYFYPTNYGCMRLNYDFNTGEVIAIAFHAKPIDEALKDIEREQYEEEDVDK